MNLNELSTPLYLGFIYMQVLPIGYLLLDFKAFNRFHKLPFSMKFPIYLTFGLLSSSVIYYLVGFAVINALVPIVTFSFFLLLLLIKKRKKMRKLRVTDIRPFFSKVYHSSIPIILFLFCVYYFSSVVGHIKWPTPSDAIVHGKFTARVIFDSKITEFDYPQGFHVTAANLSLSMNLYPGEAIFILAAAIMTLIPLVLYSLTYINTRSKVISLLAFMSAFLINTSYGVGHWLVSSFLIGRYSNIYGDLAVFLFFMFISFEYNSGKRFEWMLLFPLLLISIFLLMTYPSFLIFILIYFIYRVSVNAKMIVTYFRAISSIRKLLVIVLLSLTFSGFTFIVIQSNLFERFFHMFGSAAEHWLIPLNFLYDWRFGFLTFLGAIISILFIVKKLNVNVSLFYLILFTPIILSLNRSFFPYVSYLLPIRSVLIITCLSWVMFSILLAHGLRERLEWKIRKIKLIHLTEFFVLILFVSQYAPTLIPHFSFMQARGQKADWYLNQKGFTSDFEALEWIYENIPPDELILNDFSYSSLYLPSFSIKLVAITYIASWQNPSEETLDFAQVWRNPSDSAFLKRIIEQYDVKYIFVTSEPRFYDFIMSKNEEVGYTHKFYTPSEYVSIFDHYSFLTPIFRKEESVIYKISS